MQDVYWSVGDTQQATVCASSLYLHKHFLNLQLQFAPQKVFFCTCARCVLVSRETPSKPQYVLTANLGLELCKTFLNLQLWFASQKEYHWHTFVTCANKP